jgi:ribonuclease P protein component
VVRNQIKRGVREWFRKNRTTYVEAVDLVVIARREAADLTPRQIAKVLNEMAFSVGNPVR